MAIKKYSTEIRKIPVPTVAGDELKLRLNTTDALLTGSRLGGEFEHNPAHPGFRAVQAKIAAREGISSERAGAILAASSRHASAAAKRKNPRLKRVRGA